MLSPPTMLEAHPQKSLSKVIQIPQVSQTTSIVEEEETKVKKDEDKKVDIKAMKKEEQDFKEVQTTASSSLKRVRQTGVIAASSNEAIDADLYPESDPDDVVFLSKRRHHRRQR